MLPPQEGHFRKEKNVFFHQPQYVYLLSCEDASIYVGCTSNLSERLKRHEKGWVPATKGRLPVQLKLYLTFPNKYEAFKFEKYLKSGSGRAFTSRHFKSVKY